MIELLKYILLGIVQGITEPLPISSSGHLVIMKTLIQMPSQDYFMEIVLHFASLIAIIVLFHKRLWALIIGNINFIFKRDNTYKPAFEYALLIVIGIIPAGIAGFFLKTWIEGVFLNLLSVGISLLITGSFLLFVQKQSVDNERTSLNKLDALTIGLFQVFALLPGISRSGSTLVGGLLRKIKFERVIEFSFILYIPITIASMALEVRNINTVDHPMIPLIFAFIMSTIFTYIALKVFIHLVQKGNLKYFALYCFIVGISSITYYLITM